MGDAQEIERLSPDKLMASFSASRIWSGLFISLVVHAILIGGTSLTYIYGQIDPKWAAAREAEMKKAAEAKRAAEAPKAAPAEAPGPAEKAGPGKAAPEEGASTSGSETKPGAKEPGKAVSEHDRLMKKHANTAIVKVITATAKPEEIPEEPELGISIQETNPE